MLFVAKTDDGEPFDEVSGALLKLLGFLKGFFVVDKDIDPFRVVKEVNGTVPLAAAATSSCPTF